MIFAHQHYIRITVYIIKLFIIKPNSPEVHTKPRIQRRTEYFEEKRERMKIRLE